MSKIKKSLKKISFLSFFLCAITVLTSCSNSDNNLNESLDGTTLNASARGPVITGELTIGNKNFVLNTDGSISKFIDDKLDYSIFVVQNFAITTNRTITGYQFTNDRGEVINLTIGNQAAHGKSHAQLEVSDSDGNFQNITDIVIDDSLTDNITTGCVPCGYFVVAVIIESISEALSDNDDFFTACRKSVQSLAKACAKSGGKGSLHMESGWFGDSCVFTCN